MIKTGPQNIRLLLSTNNTILPDYSRRMGLYLHETHQKNGVLSQVSKELTAADTKH
jgi:hypothetical protein